MAWALVDDNFPNHPKAVQAGPVAAYLFVCGLCYCRRFHTDGFIPEKAVKTLGVSTNPRRIVDALLAAKLWDRADGGFRVHGYVDVYADDAGDKAKKDERRRQKQEAGRLGGLKRVANMQADAKQNSSTNEAACLSAAQAHGTGLVPCSDFEALEKGDPPMDSWARELLAVCHSKARCAPSFVERPLFDALQSVGGDPWETFAWLKLQVIKHASSHQYRVKGMVHRLDKYLREGVYLQDLPAEAPLAERVTAKTNTTLSAAAEIMGER